MTAPTSPGEHCGLFNSSTESGMRLLILLDAIAPARCDLQRMLWLDYALVHSADFSGGPPSLHPETPLRPGELLVKRELIRRGLHLMMARGLVSAECEQSGVLYRAS